MAIYGTLATDNILSIDASIADNAVDIFVYDTRKDSDGGAWRKRTQHTSWYNETLNTATRGSRREFPAVAVIVAQSDKVTIYDGDDPDMPMWMVINRSGITISSVFALNGNLIIGMSSNAMDDIRFISDLYAYRYTDYLKVGYGAIVNRGGTFIGTQLTPSGTGIVNAAVNDIAMTVLPNAPIDETTGLPIPTIAVATDGGVSVIRDDGTVVDGFTSITSIVGIIEFSGNKVIYAADNSTEYKWIYQFDIPSSDNTGNSYLIDPNSIITNYNHNADFSSFSAIPLDSTGSDDQLNYTNDFKVSPDNNIFVGAGRKLAIVDFEDGTYNSRTALTSLITSTYNTGYLPWNIKGAFLADTDGTSVTGTELVTNGTFDTDVSGWFGSRDAIISYNSGVMRIVTSSSIYGGAATQSFTTVVGKTYVASINIITPSTSVNSSLRINNGPDVTYTTIANNQFGTNSGVQTVTFTATATTTYIHINGQDLNRTIDVDNVSVRIADPDRSVNAKGLQVFGTITKSPVATGAELVGYGNFESNSAMLVKPYDSATQFGTGDFSISYWLYDNDRTQDVRHFCLNQDLTTTSETTEGFNIGTWNTNFRLIGVGGVTQTGVIHENNVWSFIHLQRKSGTLYLYINGIMKFSVAYTGNVNASKGCTIGNTGYLGNGGPSFFGTHGKLSLVRLSASAPSDEQIKKIYEDEKVLFQENAACTLYGSSDAVTALAYDEDTELLHVGTSSGRSEFKGLRRVGNTTTAVTTAISASNSLVAEQ